MTPLFMTIKQWTLYCHIHTKSNRKYIGLTSQTMLKRWNQHVYKALSSKNGRWHFPNAIRKYGKDSFEHIEFPVKYSTLEEANRAEEFAIEFWCTRDRDFGFNIDKGGDHISILKNSRPNPWADPEYRKIISDSTKKSWMNPSFRAKISTTEIRKRLSIIITNKFASRTEIICKHHGVVSVRDCHRCRYKTGKNGNIGYFLLCKRCSVEKNAIRRRARAKRKISSLIEEQK